MLIVVAFICGAIAAIIGLILYSMHIANMSYGELCDAGSIIIEAGNNRECAMALHKNGEIIDEVAFEEK